MTNRRSSVLSDHVHANTSLFSRRTSANNCLQLVVNIVPIVTYWSEISWLMVNASSAFSLPYVFSSDIGPESLSTGFHCYDSLVSGEFDHRVDGRTHCSEASHSGPSYYDVNSAPSESGPDFDTEEGEFVHHAGPSFFKSSLAVSFLPYHVYDLHTVPSLVPIPLVISANVLHKVVVLGSSRFPWRGFISESWCLHSCRAFLPVSIVTTHWLVGNLIIEWMVEPTAPRLLILVLPIMMLYGLEGLPLCENFQTDALVPIFTKGQKTKPNRTKPSTDLKRARKTEAKGAKGLKTELKRKFPDRLNNVCAFNEAKTKSKSTPGYGFGKSMEKQTRIVKRGLVDKFVRDPNKTPDSSQRPPQDCVKCGNPVEGPSCQGCALWRKKLKEVWFTICHENGIYQDLLNTSESSDDNTNVVNAPREPFVVKQDPGENSSQSPPQINHNCCYECGDSLDGIFCQQCTCKSCGKGAHIGYNCPPKAPIISNPEPCNQTIDELPQTLPCLDLTCYSGKENSLSYVSKPNFVDDSPNVFNPPPQPHIYSCEFCWNDARYGHYCLEQLTSYVIWVCQYIQKNGRRKSGIEEEARAKDRYWKILICYDDDDDEEISIPLKLYYFGLHPYELICLVSRTCPYPSESKIRLKYFANDSQRSISLLDEFAGELTLLKSIPPGIDDVNLDLEEDILIVTSFDEIDIFLDDDDSIPPGSESDDFDSEDDDNSTSRPEFESFQVDYPDGDSNPLKMWWKTSR
ncbi:hypothetical protein Tco_1338880 [Tanacetum coccineum]